MKIPTKWFSISSIKEMMQRGIQNPFVICGLCVLFLIPTLCAIFRTRSQMEKIQEIESALEMLPIKLERIATLQKNQNTFFESFTYADPQYFENEIHPLHFLVDEAETLKLLLSNPGFESCQEIQKRVNFLTSIENRLNFAQGNREYNSLIEESEWSSVRSVELSSEDLKKVLSAIEGVAIGAFQAPPNRPHLTIKRFKLKKKEYKDRETFVVEMGLIKRGIV